MTAYDLIEPVPPDFLWPGRLPMGDVSLIAGMGGVGKGLLLADLAARVSRGDVMPDGSPGQPAGDVVMITGEDDVNSTVAYRLQAARAELARVHDFTVTGAGNPFELPDCLGELREFAGSLPDARAIVIDPLAASVSVPLTSPATARRKIMAPLQRLARASGCAVICSHHLVKSGSVAGAKAITDSARAVHLVTRDPENPRVRVMSTGKGNGVADDGPALRYVVEGEGTDAAVAWLRRDESGTGTQPVGASQARVLLALRAAQGPLTPQQVSRVTGVDYAVVRVCLVRLQHRGLAGRTARGQYQAVSVAEPRSA